MSLIDQSNPPPVGATVHIYRGLMDRATTWRSRIDNPTSWAIVTSGTASSFTLSSPQHSHAVLLLVMVFTVAFLVMEARRYRYYELWAAWLRLLETEYYGAILAENRVRLSEAWQRLIVHDMSDPHFKTGLLPALSRRLRDNYLSIFLFLILSWLLKLLVHSRPDLAPFMSDTFFSHAAIGPIPGQWVTVTILVFYSAMVILVLLTEHLHLPSIEVLEQTTLLKRLASPLQQPVRRRRVKEPEPWEIDPEIMTLPLRRTDLED